MFGVPYWGLALAALYIVIAALCIMTALHELTLSDRRLGRRRVLRMAIWALGPPVALISILAAVTQE